MTSALDVSDFVSRALEAVALPAAGTALRSLLEAQVTSLRAHGCRWVNHVEDEFLVHASPALTIYHITLAPGVIVGGGAVFFEAVPARRVGVSSGGIVRTDNAQVRAGDVILLDVPPQ